MAPQFHHRNGRLKGVTHHHLAAKRIVTRRRPPAKDERIAAIGSSEVRKAANIGIIRYPNTRSDAIRNSDYDELISIIQSRTGPEFGPYEQRPFTKNMSSMRLNTETQKGISSI
ncbi:hypothetical protein [Niveibacterium terrae]|uniref:hypothetical protein n=1 Tax=Niveibacterium terrae TaxID=3373598 RepID=UPI003A8E374C